MTHHRHGHVHIALTVRGVGLAHWLIVGIEHLTHHCQVKLLVDIGRSGLILLSSRKRLEQRLLQFRNRPISGVIDGCC